MKFTRSYQIVAITLLGSIMLFFSCRQEILQPDAPESMNSYRFSSLFEAYWQGMNANYTYWKEDPTDWDQMYRIYQPRFAKLSVDKPEDQLKALTYFREMSAGLIDSHLEITFGQNALPALSDSVISPSLDRKRKEQYPYTQSMMNYDAATYLDKGYIYSHESNPSSGGFNLICGTIRKNILYLGFDAFALVDTYDSSADTSQVKKALNYYFSYIQNPPADFKGVIIDVRNNVGGKTSDLNFLLGHLVDRMVAIGYLRQKRGNGRLDYMPSRKWYITPKVGAKAIQVPVVALANRNSFSMAELTTMAIKALPTGRVVGETTWGGTGPLGPQSFYNAGTFKVGNNNSMIVNMSSLSFTYINGEVYEGRGFPPDYPVAYDESFFKSGDKQLEKAISLMP